MVVRTRSHGGSIEEEDLEMENRAEIVMIQEKLSELETLKTDVAEIEALLLSRFGPTAVSENDTGIVGNRKEWPTPAEAGMGSQWQSKRIDLPCNILPQMASGSAQIGRNVTWNQEQQRRTETSLLC